jgi:HlyD family secretion protein
MKEMNKLAFISALALVFATSCNNKEPDAFAYGNFESEEIIVSAESTGKLMEFSITEGEILNTGDYCGFIDSTQQYLKKLQLQAGISSVNARLNQIDQQLLVNKVNMNNLDREKNRIALLLEGGAATAKQGDDINGQIDLLSAQNNVLVSQKNSIRTERESLEIQIIQVNDLISKSLIKSPVKGTVLEKYLYTGELAVTGKPLFKLADMSELILRVFISGNQLQQIKLGSEINVFVDGNNGDLKKYTGTISWISGKSEFTPKIIQTRDERINLVYAVKIRVPNDGGLKIGMPGEIQL